MSARFIVLGLGGHARMVAAVAARMNGVTADLVDYLAAPSEGTFFNGLGNIAKVGDSGLQLRADIFHQYNRRMMNVIDPSAVILGECLGDAFPGAIINAGARVEVNAIVNTGAIVEHDCTVGAHSHIAPGAVLCGGVEVGERTHVGARAVIKQGVRIGTNCVIGLGAVVRRDVADGATVLRDGRVILPGDRSTLGARLDQDPA
ncbi:MAG: acetyltransferase [Rhodospirillaceae bacterium]|nr:acetyltransferase [Rhodospirillaceae bacterium]